MAGGAVIRWLEELEGTAETVFETQEGQKVLVQGFKLEDGRVVAARIQVLQP